MEAAGFTGHIGENRERHCSHGLRHKGLDLIRDPGGDGQQAEAFRTEEHSRGNLRRQAVGSAEGIGRKHPGHERERRTNRFDIQSAIRMPACEGKVRRNQDDAAHDFEADQRPDTGAQDGKNDTRGETGQRCRHADLGKLAKGLPAPKKAFRNNPRCGNQHQETRGRNHWQGGLIAGSTRNQSGNRERDHRAGERKTYVGPEGRI